MKDYLSIKYLQCKVVIVWVLRYVVIEISWELKLGQCNTSPSPILYSRYGRFQIHEFYLHYAISRNILHFVWPEKENRTNNNSGLNLNKIWKENDINTYLSIRIPCFFIARMNNIQNKGICMKRSTFQFICLETEGVSFVLK